MDADTVSRLAVLVDDTRRELYTYVRSAHRPVSREDAADAVGISRKLAAFHLDKLVAVGMLTANAERPGGIRTIGRTPKVYEPTETSWQATIPPREYGLLADILLDAVVGGTKGGDPRQTLLQSAADRGIGVGQAERDTLRPGRLGAERGLKFVDSMLQRHGYEPYRESPQCLRLSNCPFRDLARRHPDTVCAVNLRFLEGLLSGLGVSAVEASARPLPGHCCVEIKAVES